jgi:hypothetical protein
MRRTRIAAMAVLVSVVAAVVAAVVTAPSAAAKDQFPTAGLAAHPPVTALLAGDGNRGW